MSRRTSACVLALLLLGALVYLLTRASTPPTPTSIGGQGVVVPTGEGEHELEGAVLVQTSPSGGPREDARASSPAPLPPEATAPSLGGRVFVDDVERAPPGLSVALEWSGVDSGRADAAVDEARAWWSLAQLPSAPLRLWVTSPLTVPASIPVPDLPIPLI